MELPFRIENKESFRVVGYMVQTTNRRGEGRKAVFLHWSKLKAGQLDKRLLSMSGKEAFGLLGISIYNTDETDSRKFDYLIGVPGDCDAFDGLTAYTVPAGTWAVFPCTLDTLGKTQAQAITKWLPKSNYRALNKGYITGRMKSGAPDIECYGKDGEVEVWIAVKER